MDMACFKRFVFVHRLEDMGRSLVLAVVVSLLFISFCCVPAVGQSTASITGTVMDPSGAVVPSATIIITNVDTGQVTRDSTTGAGDFAAPSLPVGTYGVRVEHPGFRPQIEQNVTILTGQTINLRLTLQPGTSTEAVQVSADIQTVQTTTSDVQFTVDKVQMENLPLNGRNPFDLATLAPGATTTAASTTPGQQDNTGLSVNGFTATQNTWIMDGATYNNLHFGSAPTLPNPDTLQEFTIQTGTFSAENRGGGAVIKLTTRSGTNTFHGTVFEFFRNTVLDASNYFSKQPDVYKKNQFGGTVGGPILHDRLFFFGSYQGTIQRGTPSPQPVTVPTPAQRNGVFTNVIINPVTGLPFPNNTIPKPFDAVATKLLAYLPVAPDGGNTVYEPVPSNVNDKQYLGKLDYSVGKKDLVSARYFYDHNILDHDEATVPGFKADNGFTNQTLAVSDIHTFSEKWVLHGVFNYLRTFRHEVPVSPVTMQELGANVAPSQTDVYRKIFLTINGYTRFFTGRGIDFNPQVIEGAGDVSHTVGKHFVRVGGAYRNDSEYALNLADELGAWTFAATRTSSTAYKGSGDAFAAFLLGLPSNFVQSSSSAENFVLKTFDLWAQDDWKVVPRLTLNIGMRYEPWLPAHDTLGLLAGFRPGARSTVAPLVPAGLLFSGDSGIPSSVTRNHWNTFSPRVGFAWDTRGNGSTVVRGGFGIFRQGTEFFGQQRTFAFSTPTRTANVTINNPPSTANPYAGYSGTIPFPYQPITPGSLSQFKLAANFALSAFDPDTKPEYAESYSFAVEQRITPASSISVTYVGNHIVHGILAYNANPAVYGPGATVANTNSRVIYPGFANITLGSSRDTSNYNGLQLQYTYRAKHGLTAHANYVYSKVLDIGSAGGQGVSSNVGPSDPFNINKDYGPADYDLKHQFKTAIVYRVDGYHGSSRLVKVLANGWQTNIISVLQTGLPYTCRSGADNSFSGTNIDHCDQIGPVERPAGASKFQQWINVSSFVPNAVGTFGNMGRNSLRRPAIINMNAALVRNFPIFESVKGQFRVESFNVLNHPNLDLYNVSGGYVNYQIRSSPTFGQLTVAADPRVFQLAMKIMF